MLKEDPENTFILLGKAEGDPDVGRESKLLGLYSSLVSGVLFKSASSFSFYRHEDREQKH